VFSCSKCGQPVYIKNAELEDHILRMEVQCLNGHRSVRRMAEHQAEEMIGEIFDKLFVCTECGSFMSQVDTGVDDERAESALLCPIHGIDRREFPAKFLAPISLISADIDTSQSIIDSFRCPDCGQVYVIREIEKRDDILELDVRCPNGHRSARYIYENVEERLLTKVLQRLLHCDRCGLPGTIVELEERRKSIRAHVSCPTHGVSKKDIPKDLVQAVRKAEDEIPEDAVVRAMLNSTRCQIPLAIREIEVDKSGYKFKCACPGQGDVADMVQPVAWNESNSKLITEALLTCNECGLFTQILDVKEKRNEIEFRIVCPVHGVLERKVPKEVFSIVLDKEQSVDRVPSIVRSLTCLACNNPLHLRDVQENHGLIEFDMDDKKGHRTQRFFAPDLDQDALVSIYKNLYQCPECYEQLDLVYLDQQDKKTRVVRLCPLHGKFVLDVPHTHAQALKLAHEEIELDKLTPPEEAPPRDKEKEIEPEIEVTSPRGKKVKVLRGCEIVGGKFDYKVKVQNDSDYVITNVTVSIVAYPEDCMELGGENVKTISRIEVGGFRSPQFTFYPTKDCVQGKVVATVSYIDFRDRLHTLQVEPYLIRSVCDMLKPTEASSKEFDLVLSGLTKTDQEQLLEWNARVLFTKAEKLLPTKNFHIVDTEEHLVSSQFIGTIRGYAKGKYTEKRVAVVMLISGPEMGRHATVKLEALGDDIAMLPTTIDELAETMDSWICLRCGAPLETEEVKQLGKRLPIRCRYCSHTLTMGLYMM
jgi:DNA-directed RNA polymerase subunit RPC12/RpoP/predicted RNA-binding Zn-ribbon protein involved in translation (DUF1610 family)